MSLNKYTEASLSKGCDCVNRCGLRVTLAKLF